MSSRMPKHPGNLPKKISPFARDIATGLLEAIEHAKGARNTRVSKVAIPDPPPVYTKKRVVALRKRMGLTQIQFAKLMNVSVKSIEGWERGARRPSGPSQRLLHVTESKDAREELTRLSTRRVRP